MHLKFKAMLDKVKQLYLGNQSLINACLIALTGFYVFKTLRKK